MRREGSVGGRAGMRSPLTAGALLSSLVRMHGQTAPQVLLVAVLLLVLVALVDNLSGPSYSFSVFYLLVVVWVSAAGQKKRYLLPTAATTAVTWGVVESLARDLEHPWLPLLWNAMARFAVLYFTGLLVVAVVGAVRQEREMSRTDPLTGLHNRRGFCDLAERELGRAARSAGGFSAVYLDVDGFKAVNDEQGHSAGDRLLVDIARTLQGALRPYDLLARVGGDEFVVFLPAAGSAAGLAAARRIAGDLDAMCRRECWPVQFSLGVATFLGPPGAVDDLLAAADVLMYSAKREGRGSSQSTVQGQVFAGARAVPPAPPPESAASEGSA